MYLLLSWVFGTLALCHGAVEFWSLREGDICNVKVSFPRSSNNETEFFECVKPTQDVRSWPWEEIGIWRRSHCLMNDQVFDASYKTCRSRKALRRQQSVCAGAAPGNPFCQPPCQGPQCNVQVQILQQQPYQQQFQQPIQPIQPVFQPVVQPVQPVQQQCCQVQQQCPCVQQPCLPCPTIPVLPPTLPPQPCQPCVAPTPVVPMPCPNAPQGNVGAQPGGICSWMLAPLATDPTTPCGFLQCAPRQPGQYCGVWVKMPCAPATRFDVNVQVCVWDEQRQCGGMIQQQCCPTPVIPTAAPCVPCPVVQPTVPACQPCVQQPCLPCQQQPIIQPTLPVVQPTCTTGTLPIAPCNQQQQCPGFSTCQTNMNVCCQPVFGG